MFMENSKFFYGYASVFREKDLNGDVVLPESFVEKFLNPKTIPLFFEHNPRKKIGKITNIKQNNKGLYIEGFIENSFIPEKAKLSKKIPLSIGYIPHFQLKSKNGNRYISNIMLLEVSLVKKSANKLAYGILV